MSILIKDQIMDLIKYKDLVFSPALDKLQFRPHSVDLRLGFTFRTPKRVMNKKTGRIALTLDYYSGKKGQFASFDEITLKPGQSFDVLPGESIIGFSLENIDMRSPTLMAILFPRSSVNRRGLAVDLTGIIDAGYKGHLMFPIHNNTSSQVIRIYPGERICQVIFQELDRPVTDGYRGRYSEKSKKKTSSLYIPETNKKEIELIRKGRISEIKSKFSSPLIRLA